MALLQCYVMSLTLEMSMLLYHQTEKGYKILVCKHLSNTMAFNLSRTEIHCNLQTEHRYLQEPIYTHWQSQVIKDSSFTRCWPNYQICCYCVIQPSFLLGQWFSNIFALEPTFSNDNLMGPPCEVMDRSDIIKQEIFNTLI